MPTYANQVEQLDPILALSLPIKSTLRLFAEWHLHALLCFFAAVFM
jgi:hypothetical protein